MSIVATIRQTNDVDYSAVLDGDTLRITAPADAEIDLVSANGRIEVDGVGVSGVIDTSNGRISLQDVAGKFVLDTSNGAIEI